MVPHSVSMLPKNLQVVSFDPEWREIYLGTLRRDGFSAVCPHDVPTASKVDLQYSRTAIAEAPAEGMEGGGSVVVAVTAAKWCPLENCTVLVLGNIRVPDNVNCVLVARLIL